MRTNRGIAVEKSFGIIKTIVDRFSFKVFADEIPDDGKEKGGENKPTINYEDLIAKARKEEKDKQYSTIEKLKGQVSALTEQHNNDLLKVAELESKLSGKSDSTELSSLRSELDKVRSENTELKGKIENSKPVDRSEVEKQVRAELEAEYEVKTYKATKLAELKDEILVPELVGGSTKEEIDASINAALERSKEIKTKLGVTGGQKKTTRTRTGNPSVGGVQDNTVDIDRLATMDVRSKEYAELRRQLGLR